MMMDAFFSELGGKVLERWKQENFSLEKFPEIARIAIEERLPSEHVDLSAFIQEFLLNDDQPLQTPSGFGQPELVAYDHPRFYIQILVWMDGTTDIHQHEFSGAFHVMSGSSIHAHYTFEKAQSVTPHLRMGEVRMQNIELLEAGRTVPIVSGQSCIHSLFHLDTPSVTVVVRTQNDPGMNPQFNYLPPHMAVDPMFHDTLTMRRKQLLDLLEQMQVPGYAALVLKMVEELDFERGFYLLQHCMGALSESGDFDTALSVFEKKHGALAAGVAATREEGVRRDAIKSMRGAIAEPEHRFFLALLMNVSTRAELLRLVAQRFPEEAALETVMRWTLELEEYSDVGLSILDAVFPEDWGIEAAVHSGLFQAALRYWIKGGKKVPATLKALNADQVKSLKVLFAASSLRVLVIEEKVAKNGNG
jgi:predicted metal-dependent enzyme (double-stranded beta helix superfamily)